MASGALAATRPGWMGRGVDLILPVGLIASVLVILVPMPAALMDVLLASNITIAVIMLLTTVYVRTPLEFSIFPSLLLATTLARLVLNVATTRLILTRAETHGLMAAGGVVRAFGEFVAGNQVVVGLIIFAIIVLIQFIVITKGATRISEVAARFALDGMPGRQMAIDADLNAGAIDEREAQRRRQEITQQADFFGAMDGASKFVRGDAIAGIVIMLVNIIGGLYIGLFQAGMNLSQAGEIFTKLTIGDGLVSQVPAFLISLAAGLLVTRSTIESNLPRDFVSQLFSRPQALLVAAGFLGILIFTSLPTIPLLTLGAVCVILASQLTKKKRETEAAETAAAAAKKKPDERIEDFLAIDPMEIEIGVSLIRLADPQRGGDLLDRIQRVRKSVAGEIGIVMPKVRVRDNVRLAPNAYRIKIADMVVAEGRVESPSNPESTTLLAAQLASTVRKHADELLNRDATKHLIDELRRTSPAVVDELIPDPLKLADVQQILQLLLREQVPIRQLGAILETLGDYAPRTRVPVQLAEFVRQRLARTICTRYRDADNRLYVITLDPMIEERIRSCCEHDEQDLATRMPPHEIEAICRQISAEAELLRRDGRPAVLLVSPEVRPAVRQMTESRVGDLAVLCFNEVTRDTQIEAVAVVSETASVP